MKDRFDECSLSIERWGGKTDSVFIACKTQHRSIHILINLFLFTSPNKDNTVLKMPAPFQKNKYLLEQYT